MEGSPLDKYQPIPDKEPKVTEHVRAMVQDVTDGTIHFNDYTEDMWKEAALELKNTQAQIKSFGRMASLTLVDRSEEGGRRTYRYRAEFEKTTILQRFVFDEQGKLAASQTEDIR